MKVILTEDVKSLGKKGEIVNVSDGYARNFILKKNKGVEANGKNLNDLKLKKANDDKIAQQQYEDAQELGRKIEAGKIEVAIKMGEGGRAFGSVSSKEIADNAKYFKPFLIFNDASESGPYVAKDFKRTCDLAGLDFEKVKNMHRNTNGVLEPAIGFIPYVNAQSNNQKSIQSTLAKSYEIANRLVKAFLPNYDGDCINFIYDLRPEAMFTAQELLNAYKDGSHQETCKLMTKFFGNNGVSSVETENDFNTFSTGQEFTESSVYEAMKSFASSVSPQEQLRKLIYEILNEHPEMRFVFTDEIVDEFVGFYFSYMKVGA